MTIMLFLKRSLSRYLTLLHKVKYKSNLLCSCNMSSTSDQCKILGIETSCDDTGCAIVSSEGIVLGEALHSQQELHLNLGGIIPPIARDLHHQHIKKVVQDALNAASIDIYNVDAIATTIKPGMPLSLLIGMNYGKYLSRMSGKPFIPIHHMEAHALTIRMVQKVEFPFLVLLISGGHCLLSVVQDVDKFLLLGQSLDDAPGEAFDKAARRLKLRNLPEFQNISGGAAIELAAERGNPLAFQFPSVMSHYKDCNFSVAGLKNKVLRHILKQEKIHGVEGDGLIPGVFDLCASFQLAIATHLCRRVQRAMDYIALRNLLPSSRKCLDRKSPGWPSLLTAEVLDDVTHRLTRSPRKSLGKLSSQIGLSPATVFRDTRKLKLYAYCIGVIHELKNPDCGIHVVSGGVACNSYITRMLGIVCKEMDYDIAIPPPKLCTDNGVMIAWNGVERWHAKTGLTHDLDAIDIQAKCMLGEDMRSDVTQANIKCSWIRLKTLMA